MNIELQTKDQWDLIVHVCPKFICQTHLLINLLQKSFFPVLCNKGLASLQCSIWYYAQETQGCATKWQKVNGPSALLLTRRNSRSLTILSRTYWNQRRQIRDRSNKNGQAPLSAEWRQWLLETVSLLEGKQRENDCMMSWKIMYVHATIQIFNLSHVTWVSMVGSPVATATLLFRIRRAPGWALII